MQAIKMLRILLFCMLIITPQLLGHGVSHSLVHPGYGVAVHYDDGAPLDFADVSIFRPGETEFEFQEGLTDENGVFMFKPDTAGLWTVEVSDGLGHGKVIEVSVNEQSSTPQENAPIPRWQKVISGVGYILFIFCGWYFLAKRRKDQHAHS